MNSTPVLRKRKGRPPTGAALPVTAVRLAPELLATVDKWAKKAETNRSEAIRRLVELGLKKGK
jgi:metal-responsive CopG/Arc/MetJ family transcriptional regulator